MVYISSLMFLLSSLISFGLIYFQWSHVFSQQIISGVLLASLLLLGKFNNVKKASTPWQTSLAVLLSSFLVQILIISSGGLYSPLLIVMHIYTLGAIFLLNSKTPIIFLLLSLAVLCGQLKYDPLLTQTFANDPWTAVIYGLSFLIIVPLALYLSHNYFIKDTFTKVLKNYITMQEQKSDSILTALNDLVVVIDPELKIVSANIASEKLLQKDQNEILGKGFFDIFTLKDLTGNLATPEALSINAVMADKASRFVEGFILDTGTNIKPKAVLVQVRPLVDSKGVVTQIVFVMSDTTAKKDQASHASIQEALKRKDALMATFSHIPPETPYNNIKSKIGLITHIEEDIYSAQELEDHQFQEKPGLVDMVILAKGIMDEKELFADFLAVKTQFSYADPENTESVFVNLNSGGQKDYDLSPSLYSIPLEKKFAGLMIAKMIEIGLLTASATSDRNIAVDVSQDNDKNIYLKVTFPNPNLTEQELADFFVLSNPVIGQKTHLVFGSGLEGFLLKKISTYLNIPLTIGLAGSNKIAMEITFNKQARTT